MINIFEYYYAFNYEIFRNMYTKCSFTRYGSSCVKPNDTP